MEQNNGQQQDLLKKRQDMLRKMGVKNAGTMMNESVVSTNSAHGSMAAKLAAIKNGSAKSELNKFISATGKNSPGGKEFQGIPEPSKRKNQVKEEVKPEYKQQVETFSAEGSSELNAIESMFGGVDTPSRGGSQMLAQNPLNQEISLDSIGPSFNPQAALQQKVRSQAQNQAQVPVNNQYLKYASDLPPVANEQFEDVGAQSNQPGFNVKQLQEMMETIAKGIAEKTIRNVLNEYSAQQQQQSSKLTYEFYNKEKGIIKTPDGKYYRLTQVELKKK